MAYRQFTKCTSPTNYIGGFVAQAIIGAAIAALPLIIVIAAGAALAGPAALLGLMIPVGAIIAYCRWWLFDRLICLDGDVCAVGRLLEVEPPSEKSGLDAFDTDYSINLLLAPHTIGATQEMVQDDGVQGHLIKNHPSTVGLGVDFRGELSAVWSSDPESAVLHAEFEGGGVYKLLTTCLAVLGYLAVAAVAATIICVIPVIGWIACLIISLIFAAIGLGILGMGMANALDDTGNPADASENLGAFHEGQDILAVRGTWVYDSAHEGWNEIHPIKHCQRIGTWDGSWQAQFDLVAPLVPAGVTVDARVYRDHWCDAIASAGAALTIVEQQKPENQWEIHPDVDGCQPAPDEEDGDDPAVPR